MKKLLCLTLSLALALSLSAPALAAEEVLFPVVNQYAGFTDVKDGDWYAEAVRLCYETGLMTGSGDRFDPGETMTIAEAAVIAARIDATLSGGQVPASPAGQPWYAGYISYLNDRIDQRMARTSDPSGQERLAIAKDCLAYPAEAAKRADLLYLLDFSVLDRHDILAPINSITALPDYDESDLLLFYNAGILTGVNEYGALFPTGTLSRAECAAMVARLVKPELRQKFTPATADPNDPSFDFAYYLTGAPSDTPYLTCAGMTMTIGDYANEILELAKADPDSVLQSFEEVEAQAVFNCFRRAWPDSGKAPVADEAGRAAWESEQGMMKARCLQIADKATAQSVYAQLQTDPAQFETLMAKYGAESGLGGVFGPGEMPSALENGTKALQPGEIGAPVQTPSGWLVIQRMPLTLDDYQQALYDETFAAYLNANSKDVQRSERFEQGVIPYTIYIGFTNLSGE